MPQTKSAKERATEFATQFVSLFPEATQATARELFEKAPEKALETLGEHVLRQDDFSRVQGENQRWANDLNEYHRKMGQAFEAVGIAPWKTNPQATLQDAFALLQAKLASGPSGGTKPAAGGPASDDDPEAGGAAPKGLTVEQAKALIQEAIAGVPRGADPALVQDLRLLAGYLPRLSFEHHAKYNEVLDTQALIEHCQRQGLQLDRGGYADFVKDKEQARQKAEREQELKAAEDRGRAAGRAEAAGSSLPFPSGGPGGPGGPWRPEGTLAGLQFKNPASGGPATPTGGGTGGGSNGSGPGSAGGANDPIAAAAQHYNTLVAVREGRAKT